MPLSLRFVIIQTILAIGIQSPGIQPMAAGGSFIPNLPKSGFFFGIPPAAADGSFIPNLPKSGFFPRIPPAAAGGSFIPSLTNLNYFLEIPPAAAGGSFIPDLCAEQTKTKAGIELSTGYRRWDSRMLSKFGRSELNYPPAAASGILQQLLFFDSFGLNYPLTSAGGILQKFLLLGSSGLNYPLTSAGGILQKFLLLGSSALNYPPAPAYGILQNFFGKSGLLHPQTSAGGIFQQLLIIDRSGLNYQHASVGGILHLFFSFVRSELDYQPASDGGNRNAQQLTRYEDSRVSMGCVYTIVVYGPAPDKLQEATAAALDEVDRIDRLMSHYKNDSELSRVNREAAKGEIKIDPELFDFIAECLRYSRESEGAFDITVGPLMKAWGFFRGEGRTPSESELAEARNRIGYQRVILNKNERTINFDKPGVELDLGGIAKGYAVDRAVAILRRHGVTSALVSSGGSTIYGLGAPPGKPSWSIKVQDPVERNRTATTVRLKNQSLSVSGSYEKFFELDGVRYSHIMDPRAGKPAQGILSVAVISNDGTSGDALDNVFFVLGIERSKAWFKKFSANEVIFFLPDSGKKWKMLSIKR